MNVNWGWKQRVGEGLGGEKGEETEGKNLNKCIFKESMCIWNEGEVKG